MPSDNVKMPRLIRSNPDTSIHAMSTLRINSDTHGKQRLQALTTLRIIAAMHVVLFHCAPGLAFDTVDKAIQYTRHWPRFPRFMLILLGKGFINILASGPWSVSLF